MKKKNNKKKPKKKKNLTSWAENFSVLHYRNKVKLIYISIIYINIIIQKNNHLFIFILLKKKIKFLYFIQCFHFSKKLLQKFFKKFCIII